MTAGKALDHIAMLAEARAEQYDCEEECQRAVKIVRDALAAKDAELDEYRTQVAIAFGYDGPLGPAMFSIVESVAALRVQVAALTEERDGTARAFATLASKLTFAVGEKMALTTAHAALREEFAMFAREILHDLPDKPGDAYATANAQCAALAAANKEHR